MSTSGKISLIAKVIVFIVAMFFIGNGCASRKHIYVESGITNLIQLTSDKSIELDPCWSKEGDKIVFASDRSDYLELWMMPVKGGGIQQITSSSRSADRSPDFSPDQTEIVFQSTRVTGNWNIWKISLGNRGLTQLTNNPYGAFAPKYSPDGKKIAYYANDKDGNTYIWLIGPNGEEPTQLGLGADPVWSPDGKRIAFSKVMGNNIAHIWIMDTDGSNTIQMTTEEQKFDVSPCWSKDGKKLVYVVKYAGEDYFYLSNGKAIPSYFYHMKSEIWVMDIQGGKPTQLTAFEGLNSFPAWSPNGRIAFISNRGDSWDIWLMTPNLK